MRTNNAVQPAIESSTEQTDAVIQEMLKARKEIGLLEYRIIWARRSMQALRIVYISLPIIIVGTIISIAATWRRVDLGWLAGSALFYAALCAGTTFIVYYLNRDQEAPYYTPSAPENPRLLELDLNALQEKQALLLSGARVAKEIRQYSYQGEVQRSVAKIRKESSRYRRVNNLFQSIVIVGSLATTTAASLNTGEGALKWVSIGLSFVVGISAGFMGYFKYRERAFYLQQTADDIEEQMNGYRLGLPPYVEMAEVQKIELLTKNVEAIRIAQQRREQQLDQPQSSKDES